MSTSEIDIKSEIDMIKTTFEQQLLKHPNYTGDACLIQNEGKEFNPDLLKYPYYFRRSSSKAGYYVLCQPYLFQRLEYGVYQWTYGDDSHPFLITDKGFEADVDNEHDKGCTHVVYTSLEEMIKAAQAQLIRNSQDLSKLVDMAEKPRFFVPMARLIASNISIQKYQQACRQQCLQHASRMAKRGILVNTSVHAGDSKGVPGGTSSDRGDSKEAVVVTKDKGKDMNEETSASSGSPKSKSKP